MMFPCIGMTLSIIDCILLGIVAVLGYQYGIPQLSAVIAVPFVASAICLWRNAKDLRDEIRRRKC